MYLTHISLTNFRAYTRLDLDVPKPFLLLTGSNAQGKTTVLEAIYFLATFTSFHAQNDRQLLSFMVAEEPLAVGRIVADFQRGEKTHRLEARLILEKTNGGGRLRKEVLVDGVKRSIHEALGHFNAVIFLPQMARIIESGPDERRRYLNLLISQAIPEYARSLSDYSQVLSQRNALLKQLAEKGGDRDQLCYWDEMLASHGSNIINNRMVVICELEQLAARIHHRLTNSSEILRLDYQPGFDPTPHPENQLALPIRSPAQRTGLSTDQIRNGMLDRLSLLRNEEIRRGITTIGPHRDEMRLLSNGVDLGDYGSRGQGRTALLALKLAEVLWLKNKTGDWPVLLLDEIMAELDGQRRLDLLDALADCEQVLLTTTDIHLFADEFVDRGIVWRVEEGRVTLPDVLN